MNDPIPHSRPFVGEAEAAAAAQTVLSRRIAQGPRVAELERQWSSLTGTVSAAATGSGVGALRLALLGLGVGSGDEVVMPAYSCVALMNAVLALGGVPVLADVLPGLWTLSPEDARRRITPRTKALIAVHLFGMPAAIGELGALGIPVIEDCAHGIGGRAGGKPFGGASAASIGSFYATKMFAAGEGGIVASGDPDLIARVRTALDYGDQPPDGRHLNDKMTDIAASLALCQVGRIADILERRAARAAAYAHGLAPLARAGLIRTPPDREGRIWYRYAVELARHDAAAIVLRMKARGVHAEQPVWDLRGTAFWNDTHAGTALAFDRVLSLPLYPDLSESEQARVCAALQSSLSP